MKWRVVGSGWLLMLAVFVVPAAGEDHFLTIGGGYSPTGNQISLESNALLFQRLVGEKYPNGTAHNVYFSDGTDPGRDLQFEVPPDQVPRVNRLLARVFRQSKYLQYQYRSHEVPNVRGASSRENLQQWFDENAPKLQPGDRLFLYATAHGGSSDDEKQPFNTKLYLWNRQTVPMKDLVEYLDRLHEDVTVVVVMVQCYAGGYANIVFQDGDRENGFSAANRCGFYATVHDRPAAGCTADVNEENYQEYSSSFFEAIRGETRTGRPIERPDYDGDGRVSFDEAHAYARLTSSTIDIPLRTSGAFLRAFSRQKSEEHPDLLSADSPFSELLELAGPAERAVLEGLSRQLELTASARAQEANELAKTIKRQKKQIDKDRRKQARKRKAAASAIRRAVVQHWPELSNRWHPRVSELLSVEADAIVELIESHPRFAEFEELSDEVQRLSAEKLDLDRRWAKCQRLIRALENVALAANLGQVAPCDVQRRYKQLVAAESGHLGEQADAQAAVAGSSN